MTSFLACSVFLVLACVPATLAGSRTYGSSCGSCGGGNSASYNNGKSLGGAVAGVIGNKLQHIAGFFDGLSGGGNSGCGGCSSSCGSPGCGSSYGGPAFLAHARQKVSNIVGLTALRLAFFMGYE